MYEFRRDMFDVRAADFVPVGCSSDIGADGLLSWTGDVASLTPSIGRGVEG
jgi:hypothetical protein